MLFIVTLGLGEIFRTEPALHRIISWLGFAVMVYLGYLFFPRKNLQFVDVAVGGQINGNLQTLFQRVEWIWSARQHRLVEMRENHRQRIGLLADLRHIFPAQMNLPAMERLTASRKAAALADKEISSPSRIFNTGTKFGIPRVNKKLLIILDPVGECLHVAVFHRNSSHRNSPLIKNLVLLQWQFHHLKSRFVGGLNRRPRCKDGLQKVLGPLRSEDGQRTGVRPGRRRILASEQQRHDVGCMIGVQMTQEKPLHGVGLNACCHRSAQRSAAEIKKKPPSGGL